MIQAALDFSAHARSRDPETSHEAAARVDGKRLAQLVLECLQRDGPGTSHDIADRLGLELVTVSPRMKPLETAGDVERVGKVSGRTVWRAL